MVRQEVGSRLDWPGLGIASRLWRRGWTVVADNETSLLLLEVGVGVWKAAIIL